MSSFTRPTLCLIRTAGFTSRTTATISGGQAILEFPPRSLKPSSREITKGFFNPEGLAYYPPVLP